MAFEALYYVHTNIQREYNDERKKRKGSYRIIFQKLNLSRNIVSKHVPSKARISDEENGPEDFVK